MTTDKKDTIQADGAVLYCDGGTRPQPGFGGFGVHGYLYSKEAPKKGSGNPTQYLFEDGYKHKSLFKEGKDKKEITPINYINGFSAVPGPTTNNICEILGACTALDIAKDKGVNKVTIYTDSKLVVGGATQWLQNWKKNNWIKSDGQEVANVSYWKMLDDKMTALTQDEKTVEFKWTKGHSDCFGNNIADVLATVGVLHSTSGHLKTEIDYVSPEGYWKPKGEVHPFLSLKRLLFCTTQESNNPGEYYLADHDTDDDILGKRIADATYAYIKINEPDPVIEMIRQKQIKVCDNQNSLSAICLDQVTSSKVYETFLNYGEHCCYQRDVKRTDLVAVDKTPVTIQLEPIRLSIRAVEAVNVLCGILKTFQEDKSVFTPTDITSLIYDKDEKGKTKLKSEIGVGIKKIDIQANYAENKVTPIELFFDVDFMSRNSLKRLEDSEPEVTLITWIEADNTLRYATICKNKQGDVGIWCGFYSNMKFIFH